MKADPERTAPLTPTEASFPVVVAPRAPTEAERALYPFVPAEASIRPLIDVAAAPDGYRRVDLEAGTFGAYLRGLPLRPAEAEVRSYTGATLRGADDPRVFAVAEIDVSPLDVQQCADSVIRWHAEWLWSRGEKKKIGYHFLSGDFATYGDYASGRRPEVKGNKVSWATSAAASDDRKTFRRYLDMVFNYASTISLAIRTQKIDRAELEPGDFVVLPGGPGHAILILDVATNSEGKRVALLGQGFMPAQDFHVLESQEKGLSPWFSLEGEAIDTPFWPEPFPWTSLRRFAR
ncbi:MAG: hypothetical protein HOV80_31585 [Polyangiaceae bacterium]|nr:hypothetical protein [Polyangiaceae bacterium]